MGVIHKLKPEIVKFILAAKEQDPSLSCRKLVPILKKKFKKEVSKSSISSVLKRGGESSAVGKHLELFVDCVGAFFMKGTDHKFRFSFELTQALKDKFPEIAFNTLQSFNEVLIFMRAFGINDPINLNKYQGSGLWILCGLNYDRLLPSKINNYYKSLQDKTLYYNIALRLVSCYSHITETELNFAKEENISSELEAMFNNLVKLAQRQFFSSIYWNLDFHQMHQRFLGLGGYMRRSKGSIILRFTEQRSLDIQLDLAQACKKFNELEVCTIPGQKISLQPPI